MANPEWDNYAPPPQRYRLMGDDSGHEYFVPVGKEQEFDKWVSEESGEIDFSQNRIDGRFTFIDPRCE
jgi:hypothetical protein